MKDSFKKTRRKRVRARARKSVIAAGQRIDDGRIASNEAAGAAALDPVATFEEWDSERDRRAYADL